MNNIFSTKFSGFVGGFALAAGLFALGTGAYAQRGTPVGPRPTGAEFTDRRLTPQSQPPAAVGNDLLLAENALGGTSPESWSMDLQMSDAYTGSGPFVPDSIDYDIFPPPATGPTGVYPTTIGDGKHAENTLADILAYYKPGQGTIVYYEYVVTDQLYKADGTAYPPATITLGPYSYTP